MLLDECQIPLQECERLDESLALALKHLTLPEGWSVLGTNLSSTTAHAPQETLLHFAARRGLRQVAVFLLQQPGGREALRVPNKQGVTPAGVAEKKGHSHLHQLLTQEEVLSQSGPLTISSEGGVVQYHPRLNTYTLTVGTAPGCPVPSLQRDVEELRRVIRHHTESKGGPLSQPPFELLNGAQECSTGPGAVTEKACLDRLQQPAPCGVEESSEQGEAGFPGQPSRAGDRQSEAKPAVHPDPTERPPSDGSEGDGARPCQNSGRDYQAREEGEEGLAAAGVGDSGKASDKGADTAQSPAEGERDAAVAPSCGKQQEEADTAPGAISGSQGGGEEPRAESQEEGRPAETAGHVEDDPGGGGGTAETDMGHAQSQEYSQTSEPDGEECAREVERDGVKTEEVTSGEDSRRHSVQEGEGGSEDGGMSVAEDGGEDGGEKRNGEIASECPSLLPRCSSPSEAGLKSGTSGSEPSQEAAAVDCSTENECGDTEVKNNCTPELEREPGACGKSCASAEVETGNLTDEASSTAEQSESTDGPLSQTEDEDAPVSHSVAQTNEEALCSSQPSAEEADTEEKAMDGTEERVAEECHQESQSDSLETESQEVTSTKNDITSCSLPEAASAMHGDGDKGDAIPEVAPVISSEEDSFQSISSSIAEPSLLLQGAKEAEVSRETLSPQAAVSPEQEETATPSQADQALSCPDVVSPSETVSDAQREGECLEELVTSPTEEPLPSVGAVTKEPSPEPTSHAASESDGPQTEQLEESEASDLKQENQEAPVGLEVSESDSATPSDLKEEEGHGPAPPETQTEQEGEEEEETAKEEQDTLSIQESGLEIMEAETTTEVGPVNTGDPGPENVPPLPEGDTPHPDTENEEGAVEKDSELAAGEVVAPSAPPIDEVEGDPAVPTCPERVCETAIPADCDPIGPSTAGTPSFVDAAVVSPLGLEIVEEEAEDIEETSPESGEGPHTTAALEDKETLPEGDEVDSRRKSCSSDGVETTRDTAEIHREKDTFYSIDPCADPTLLEKKRSSECPESPVSPTPKSVCSSVSTTQRDSYSDADGFFSTDTGEDSVFRKAEEPVTGDSTSEVSVSCSSTDDTASVGPPSSTPDSCVDARRWSSEEVRQPGGAVGAEAEEEEKDRLTEVPVRSAILRSSIRSLSPFRRHSWGPGKNPGGEAEMNQRSSLRSLGDGKPTFHRRSYSLEGLTADREGVKDSPPQGASPRDPRRLPRQESEERGSLVSLTEEEQESDLGECSSLDSQKSGRLRPVRHSCPSMTLPLTKSVSMLAISQRELDAMGRTRPKRRISFSFSISPILPKSKTVFSIGSSSSDEEESGSMRTLPSASGSLGYSISEEDPGPLRSDSEGKGVTKVSRTFSYLKSKMYKKTKEKDKDKSRDKEKEAKEKEKQTLNGHLFSAVNSALSVQCYQCNKAINTKDASYCTNCNAHVHKGCRESLPLCAKVKMKQQKQQQQYAVPDSASMPAVTLRSKTTTPRERPWSAISAPDDPTVMMVPRRHTSIMPFNSSNLSKSISISNIAGPVFDEMPLKSLRYLSQSTDSLHKTSKVNESTESLTDEGTEMMDSQLMGEFETDAKELEADSWSFTVDKKYLKQLKKDVIKRQDVIYELIQTEMHHVRTLKIMADVYSKGLVKEVQLEPQTVERVFPVLEDLLEIHTGFFSRILERKRESQQEGKDGGFVIRKIGDVLVTQFSGSNAERMKKVYGKFCSRHSEAVNFYKELHTKDKRFQAFIKKKMSSTIVRRLGIPECILLVTQRITKYPVLLQRILQHTKENEEDHKDVTQALRLVKEVIAAVDSKVNEHEKKRRLKEVYSRTDSKSIMRMKSGQMFAREDLMRGRRLLHDGALQLKNSAGRLKEVQALLLSDVFVFLQEKDQKYVFASLDQRSTVISLQKLIVREVANEEKGLFLITAGIEKPEMVEVHASTKEERNTWMQLIQEAMHSIEKDEDEGIPSETEEDKRLLETKAKEMRDQLRKKDEQIVALLEEKVKLFRDMCDSGASDDGSTKTRMLFRASAEEVPKGEPVMKDALKEVETLQTLVNGSLGGAMGQLESASGVGPVCLPRRAETFGGFDSHQMSISKNGEKDEGEDSPDLRRTESDSVLKKGGNSNLLLLLKRNSEQVLHSVTHLHDLLNTLQAVVVQQDSFIEEQRQALSERPASRPSSRPSSLIEQEKQRSLEKQRQEAANLQRQQAAHAEERRRREREWEAREQALGDREAVLNAQEEEAQRKRKELEAERQELHARKEEYQRDLERLRDAQRRLERDKDQLRREQDKLEQMRIAEEKMMKRTSSTASEDSLMFQSSGSLDRDVGECELSSSPRKDSLSRLDSKRKGKNLNPFASNPSQKAQSGESQNQIPTRLLQLAKKDKKDKKKKKSKGQHSQPAESTHLPVSDQPVDGEIFFC
ncbi:A-kinase anchor protein 13-like isoform X2 [Megalops cyprinoides]|uniref:A-kinase anchor protein 13-like isoform X2 n=1 Tax=Megalops cyprinoides TaxID=118141 RepID=UPI001863FAC6|nr:A-kinase anchor protein 13-like isoform X2 [Megalops cyprinoides]